MGANKIHKHYVQREMQLIDVTAEKNQSLLGTRPCMQSARQ